MEAPSIVSPRTCWSPPPSFRFPTQLECKVYLIAAAIFVIDAAVNLFLYTVHAGVMIRDYFFSPTPRHTIPQFEAETGNSVLISEHPQDTVQWRLQAITRAKSRIIYSACYLGEERCDEILELFRLKLAEEQNMRITLLASSLFITHKQRRVMEELKKTGRFEAMLSGIKLDCHKHVYNSEQHIKALVADDVVVAGGSNNTNSQATDDTTQPLKRLSFIGQLYQDMDVVMKGPIALSIAKALAHVAKSKFNDEIMPSNGWDKLENHPDCVKDVTVKAIISNGPLKAKQNPILKEIIDLMKEAEPESTVYFSQMSVLFHNKLLDSLTQLPASTKVKIISGGDKIFSVGGHILHKSNRYFYYPLLKRCRLLKKKVLPDNLPETKTSIYESIKPTIYHKKHILIKNSHQPSYSCITSFNLNPKSYKYDWELFIKLKSDRLAEQFERIFHKDLEHAKEITEVAAKEYHFRQDHKLHANLSMKILRFF